MAYRVTLTLFLALVIIFGLAACSAGGQGAGRRDVSPGDFASADAVSGQPVVQATQPRVEDQQARPQADGAGEPAPADAAAAAGPAQPAAGVVQTVEAPTDDLPQRVNGDALSDGDAVAAANDSAADRAHVLDAMVGQVNGRALYASKVLQPLEPQLAAMGRRYPRSDFRELAAQRIRQELQSIIVQELLLGEAERNLTDQERQGLKVIMERQREELLRKYGENSLAKAEAQVLEQTGRTLEQTLEDARRRVVMQRYLETKLLPKINITRKDIERFYQKRQEEQPPTSTRTIRIIRVRDPASAPQIERMLAEGTPFEQVARESANLYKRDQGGLFGEGLEGDVLFGDERDEAMKELKAGEHSPPIKVGVETWWVHVEKLEEPDVRPLHDVQLQLEQELRMRRFQMLSDRHRDELLGDFVSEQGLSAIDQMARDLVEVAVTRFARGN